MKTDIELTYKAADKVVFKNFIQHTCGINGVPHDTLRFNIVISGKEDEYIIYAEYRRVTKDIIYKISEWISFHTLSEIKTIMGELVTNHAKLCDIIEFLK